MSLTCDWNLICTVVWILITLHWSIVAAGHGKKLNLGEATASLFVGGSLYFLSRYFEWPPALNLGVLTFCIFALCYSFSPEMNAPKSYSNVWKYIEPTIEQDWTMALPVVASILLFWM